MLDGNPKFQEFRQLLHDRSVDLYSPWSTKRNRADRKQKYDEVFFLIFRGNGFTPHITTAVVIDYGKDGFGLYTDAGESRGTALTLEQEADLIAKGSWPVKLADLAT